MAIKDLIGPSFVGTTTVKFVVTRGLSIGVPAVPEPLDIESMTIGAAIDFESLKIEAALDMEKMVVGAAIDIEELRIEP